MVKPIVIPPRPQRATAFARGRAIDGKGLAVRAFSGAPCEIDLYGEIGFDGISASMFRSSLASLGAGDLVMRINSDGGDVFDGIAIYNDLVASGRNVTVRITGVAGSAASIVAMAGSRIEIAPNAHFMIHNAWCEAQGNARELRDTAAILESIDGSMAETYHARTGLPLAEIRAMMGRETWLTAAQAVEMKFCDALMAMNGPAQPFAANPIAASRTQPRFSASEANSAAQLARSLEKVRRALRS